MRAFCGIMLLFFAVVTLGDAQAKAEWPKQPITLVVPYAPGGYGDSVARISARYLEKALGVNIVVENRAGAGGIIGTAYVARSAPDGYTLCFCSVGAISVAPLAGNIQYDPLKDLIPISIVSTIPQTVIIRNSLPIKTVADLINYAKAHPGELKYGSSGPAGLMHYSVALFAIRTGTQLTHVPYKGGAPATMAVVAGEVDFSFTNMTDALPQMEAKTVRGIAVTSLSRSPFAPELPTMQEVGIPNFSAESWNGVMAPAGTPAEVVERLARSFKEMEKDKEVVKAMALVGATAVSTTPGEYRQRIEAEMKQWSELLKEFQKPK